MSYDINQYINLAATQGPDMSKSQSSSSNNDDYTPPAQGPCGLRFVGYIEVGQRREDFKGDVKIKDKVKLIFELHGKNYPPREVNGVQVPQRITITESISYHEKANFKKLFLAMRDGDESITHMAQLLGQAFKGRVYHKSFTGQDGKVKTFARLRDDTGYSIGPAVVEDPETGEVRPMRVPEPLTETKLFLWRFADKAMWESIYIDGSYSDGRSKNLFQEEIKQAINFKGSPIDRVLNASGVDEALGEVSTRVPDTGNEPGKAFRPAGVARGGSFTRPRGLSAAPAPAEDQGDYDDVPM